MATTKVAVCEATNCAYNHGKSCRAFAITIGTMDAANCGTFAPADKKGGVEMTVANVGACKMSGCAHNKDLMCQAKDVRVGVSAGQVRCLSFEAR